MPSPSMVTVAVGDNVDDLFTMERSTSHVDGVFVAAETNPRDDLSGDGVVLVEIDSRGIRLTGSTERGFNLEIDRGGLYSLAVALMRVAIRVQTRHSPCEPAAARAR